MSVFWKARSGGLTPRGLLSIYEWSFMLSGCRKPPKSVILYGVFFKKRNSNVLHTGSKTYNTFTVERAERDKRTCGQHLIKNRLKNIGSQSQKTKKSWFEQVQVSVPAHASNKKHTDWRIVLSNHYVNCRERKKNELKNKNLEPDCTITDLQ